jgi:hypothetical protein
VHKNKTINKEIIPLLGSSGVPATLGFAALVPSTFFHWRWLDLGSAQIMSHWCAIICVVMLIHQAGAFHDRFLAVIAKHGFSNTKNVAIFNNAADRQRER